MKVLSVVQQDLLQGRWTIKELNGQAVGGLILELGGEGAGAVEKRSGGLNTVSPQPPINAYLGCNHLRLSGWSRNGDKLSVGTAWSTIRKRGCDPSVMAVEDRTQAILRLPMNMELITPDRLRLVSEAGTLDLVRWKD